MKTKQILIAVCMFFSILIGQKAFAQDGKGKDTVTFYIEEMECKNCQAKIEKNIAFEKGVLDIICDLKTRKVQIVYKTDKTNPDKLAKGFQKIGMEAVVDSTMVTEPIQ